MTTPSRPRLGRMVPILVRDRPKKVWKHLYNLKEAWERITGQDVSAMRNSAERVAGCRRADHRSPPLMEADVWRKFCELALGHHDDPYVVAYWAAFEDAETRWTLQPDRILRHRALSPQSIFLVVQLGDPSRIVTAYRPLPPRADVMTEEAIRRHGENQFAREAQMSIDTVVQRVAEELHATASPVPAAGSELWWLASAVGFGRLLAAHPTVAAVLPGAEASLAAVGRDVRAELAAVLDWDGTAERLADGVQDDRPEDLEAALTAAEELLAVADAIGEEARAGQFLGEVEGILAWVPPEWSHLLPMASARCAMFEGCDKPAVRLWSSVEASVVGATLREMPPTMRPEARLVSQMLGEVGAVSRIVEAVRARAQGLASNAVQALEAVLACVSVNAHEPTLTVNAAEGGNFDVIYPERPEGQNIRMFIVDADHPDGEDVTDTWEEGEVAWSFSAADGDTLIVLVRSEQQIPPVGLEALLSAAGSGQELAVLSRTLTPPT